MKFTVEFSRNEGNNIITEIGFYANKRSAVSAAKKAKSIGSYGISIKDNKMNKTITF